ncbi:conserved hypothetical protein [Neospora caninum Liverpool]|uniref:Uncharacterized protein n=1 Tax=Neospora caninum (strain Liverpool) TaxID=572307 RepID=F0V850_NEOCL|nr:conserved hypothetical protein [Neospora caninum Liverpool]CBZ49891.1 conserved hypothetical protein [Neospora caninum Liverpool]CEL64478.1 TPA: hypothetical protein BN1204_003760 [Neospora caninum Liverpool]|eukprot:XP_003879926.1 conserved hypothetical protein [Neospora caninum Liverpool]
MFRKAGKPASAHLLAPGVGTRRKALRQPCSREHAARQWSHPFRKRWEVLRGQESSAVANPCLKSFSPAPCSRLAAHGSEHQRQISSRLLASRLTSRPLAGCWNILPVSRGKAAFSLPRETRSFSSVIVSRSRKGTRVDGGGQQSVPGRGRKRYRCSVETCEEEGERKEFDDNGLPRLVRRAVEASYVPRAVPLSFWKAQADQALRLLPSLLPFHLASLLLAYARAGVRHPPLAAAIVRQFADISSRQRYHPLLLSPRSTLYANSLEGGNEKLKRRSAHMGSPEETEEERQRVDFAAFSTVLLSLERLHLLQHPLVYEPAERLQGVLLHRLQGHCDSFTFRQLKRLMLLLAKLSAVASARCSTRGVGAHADTHGGSDEDLPRVSAQIQTEENENKGGQAGEARRPLENRSFLVEVMVAAAEKAMEAVRPPADAAKVVVDDREMFPVAWCITRFDQMLFSKMVRKDIHVAAREIPSDGGQAVVGTGNEDYETRVGRRTRERSRANEASATPPGGKACPREKEQDDGFSYKFVAGGTAYDYPDDGLTKDMIDMYTQAREKLLGCATRGVRTIIVSRLRCAPLDAAMALDAYLLLNDPYMSTKAEHYFSFVLSNANVEELLTLADGFRHLRIAQGRVWNVWCQHTERCLTDYAGQDNEGGDRADPSCRLPPMETLQAVRGWFDLLGRACPLADALLVQATLRAGQEKRSTVETRFPGRDI